MTHHLTLVPLREILIPISRRETVNPEIVYRILGARWYAQGLYIKEIKSGSEIQAKDIYRVEAGDFVYNRLFAWKGSFAIATNDNHDCYVSNEFPCFSVNADLADPRYLRWYFSRAAAWDEALGLSTGGTPTSRNRLKEERLLAMRIPLPTLENQLMTATRIEDLVAKVSEAQDLRRQADTDSEAILRAVIFDSSNDAPIEVLMRELVRLKEPDVVVLRDEVYHFAGVYCFGRGVFKGQRKSGLDFAYPRLTRLRAGDFVYPKLMAWEGALGVVPPECDGLVVSTEFPVFEVNEARVLPETLDVYFRTPSVWPILAGASTGTNVRRRRLNPADFLNFKMPVPTMSAQLRLRQVKAKLDSIKPLRSEIATQLDALLPSILDKAFRGEL